MRKRDAERALKRAERALIRARWSWLEAHGWRKVGDDGWTLKLARSDCDSTTWLSPDDGLRYSAACAASMIRLAALKAARS